MIYTYTSNSDPSNGNDVISLRSGTLLVGLNQYADLTQQEINAMNAAGCSLFSGIFPGARPAGFLPFPFGDPTTIDLSGATTGQGLIYDSVSVPPKWKPSSMPTAPAGATGITQQNRLVGGTSSGAPTSGTYQVGDVSVDALGVIWSCVTGGTPGTWVIGGSGVELASAELSSDPTNFTTTLADVTGLSITFTAPVRVFLVDLIVPKLVMGAATNCQIYLTDSANVVLAYGNAPGGNATGLDPFVNPPIYLRTRLPRVGANAYAITPGNSYTFKIRTQMGSSTGTFNTDSGQQRPILRAVTC